MACNDILACMRHSKKLPYLLHICPHMGANGVPVDKFRLNDFIHINSKWASRHMMTTRSQKVLMAHYREIYAYHHEILRSI